MHRRIAAVVIAGVVAHGAYHHYHNRFGYRLKHQCCATQRWVP